MKLFLVTNRKQAKIPFLDVIKEAVDGGLDGIILRENDLTTEELFPIAEDILNIIHNKDVELIINGNLELAEKLGLTYHSKEKFFQKNGIVHRPQGVSVHSVEINFLEEILEVGIPTIAIGGINSNTLEKIVKYDLMGVAVMSEIMASTDPFEQTRKLKAIRGD